MHERQRFEGHRPIGTAHAKNTLSSLINKVAYGKTRVVLESRGKPKAALISTEDLEKPERLENRAAAPKRRLNILLRAQALRAKMRRLRKSYSPIPRNSWINCGRNATVESRSASMQARH